MEMLIVVGIIGILSTLGTFSFNTAQRNARDIERQSDISAVQKGMEQYFAKVGEYTCSETLLRQSGALPDGFPTDPKSGNDTLFITLLQQYFAYPFAGKSIIPQAYAQGGCVSCINNASHATACTNTGGEVRFSLSCDSTYCCWKGGSSASPTPTPGSGSGGASPTPSSSPGSGGGSGGGGTGAPSNDQAAVSSDELNYTLSRCSLSSYCACTRLERDGTGNASDRNCTWQTNGDFYCLQQAQ